MLFTSAAKLSGKAGVDAPRPLLLISVCRFLASSPRPFAGAFLSCRISPRNEKTPGDFAEGFGWIWKSWLVRFAHELLMDLWRVDRRDLDDAWRDVADDV